MEVIKKTDRYTIVKKRSGRYGVRGKNKRWISGNEKMEILQKEGLVNIEKNTKKKGDSEDSVEAHSSEQEAIDQA